LKGEGDDGAEEGEKNFLDWASLRRSSSSDVVGGGGGTAAAASSSALSLSPSALINKPHTHRFSLHTPSPPPIQPATSSSSNHKREEEEKQANDDDANQKNTMADGADNNNGDLSRVYAAVAAGESDEEVRSVIAECGNEQQREMAVNATDPSHDETPLAAAHRLGHGDLVGALLEAGADTSALFDARVTPLVLCIAYGLADSMRALLKAGHDPNKRLEFEGNDSRLGSPHGHSCTAAHLCLAPPPLWPGGPDPPPQLACLEVLLQEGKADINAVDSENYTPLYWLARHVRPSDAHLAALDLLLRLGADVDARGGIGDAPVFWYAGKGYLAGL
jgi:hypothetical protein